MKRLLFTTGLLFISLIIFSQNGVYRTYEDFKNNNLEDIGQFKYNDKTGGSAHLNYKISGKKKKLECKEEDFWGFMYEGHLFRNDHDYGGLAYIVISKGDYIYYENGSAYTRAIYNEKQGIKKEIRIRKIGYKHPISLDLNSKFISTHKVWSQFKKFAKKNPRFKKLKTCFEAAGIMTNKREDCVQSDINETKNFYPWEDLIFYTYIEY